MAKKNYKSKTDLEIEQVNESQEEKLARLAKLTEKLSEIIELQNTQLTQQSLLLASIMIDLQYVNFGMHEPEYIKTFENFLNN